MNAIYDKTSRPARHSGNNDSPHLDADQVRARLEELEYAKGQRRCDLMTDLAWRPAWAIRSRAGVGTMLWQWWKTR